MFIGSKQLGISALRKIHELSPSHLSSIVTIADRHDGSRSKLDEFEAFAKVSVVDIDVLSDPSALKKVVDEKDPELCITVGWYWLLDGDLLGRVPGGFVGLHASLLPKYRGGAPLVWALINGEKQSGITLFHIDEGMDTGDIIGQESFEIRENDMIGDLLKMAELKGIRLLEKYFPLLLSGSAPRTPQSHADVSYCSQRRPQDGKISWNMTNRDIHNAIRAQTHPYPGAYCYTEDGEHVHLWRSKIFPHDYYGIPGLITQVSDDQAIVACGRGAICLQEVEMDKGKTGPLNRFFSCGMRLS